MRSSDGGFGGTCVLLVRGRWIWRDDVLRRWLRLVVSLEVYQEENGEGTIECGDEK